MAISYKLWNHGTLRFIRDIRVFFFFVALSLPCWAQDRGTITGRVTDPSGSVVANAAMTITNLDTGIKITSMTNASGNYSVAGLAFGKYEIACEAPGFRKYVRKEVNLDVAQTLSLDIPLEVGAVDQTVEVTAAAPLLEQDTSDLGTVIDKKQVEDLPLSVNGNIRNPASFVLLAPGVVGNAADTEINGSQDRAKAVLLDGAISTGPESGGTLFTYPPVESIGEFKL